MPAGLSLSSVTPVQDLHDAAVASEGEKKSPQCCLSRELTLFQDCPTGRVLQRQSRNPLGVFSGEVLRYLRRCGYPRRVGSQGGFLSRGIDIV